MEPKRNRWSLQAFLRTNNWGYTSFSDADINWIETNAVAVYVGEPIWQQERVLSEPQREALARNPRASPDVTVGESLDEAEFLQPATPVSTPTNVMTRRVWSPPAASAGPRPGHKRGR